MNLKRMSCRCSSHSLLHGHLCGSFCLVGHNVYTVGVLHALCLGSLQPLFPDNCLVLDSVGPRISCLCFVSRYLPCAVPVWVVSQYPLRSALKHNVHVLVFPWCFGKEVLYDCAAMQQLIDATDHGLHRWDLLLQGADVYTRNFADMAEARFSNHPASRNEEQVSGSLQETTVTIQEPTILFRMPVWTILWGADFQGQDQTFSVERPTVRTLCNNTASESDGLTELRLFPTNPER